MKTVRIHSYGGPEVSRYEDAPRPEPATSETLVRIHAAAVNPVDWMIRNGYGKDWWRHQMPLTLGCEYAGVVEAVGAGVSQVKPGDEVFGFINLVNNGAYAEFAVARETEVALKPKSLDFVKAATLPVAALTSWQALFDIGKLAAGQKVLIHAAAGGVGSIAVQLAKAKGATVLGTASARNLEFLRQLGVDEPIDYTAVRFEDVARDVDVVFDTIGGETQERSFAVLKPGGVLVSAVSPPAQELAAARGVSAAMVQVQPNAAQLAEIAALADAGKIVPNIETVLPLSEFQRAHELSQSGRTRGKIVLQVQDQ
ncbi:MAG TPA: NADP-dependent oxidoreductase [Blastocatellia bacterium]|nr:NADP-dependent oxidoreductase [Blastocatellia bacterium]HMX25027.1 NADP-dependent oxidoreductase [Blastocatellia bacterium]HMY74281.1 NADP-dependent oxidoreductase [Blastocatellia bacterium]HMZ18749.1 NADP-dependent oxidoreductase [Blastocatellia bacterium]HNG30826.1 NADP-dependent oxidoreductase [Blastocatellia bacterium]